MDDFIHYHANLISSASAVKNRRRLVRLGGATATVTFGGEAFTRPAKGSINDFEYHLKSQGKLRESQHLSRWNGDRINPFADFGNYDGQSLRVNENEVYVKPVGKNKRPFVRPESESLCEFKKYLIKQGLMDEVHHFEGKMGIYPIKNQPNALKSGNMLGKHCLLENIMCVSKFFLFLIYIKQNSHLNQRTASILMSYALC